MITCLQPNGVADRSAGLEKFLESAVWPLSKPLFIVENGLGAVDIPDENGYVADDYRIDYLEKHVKAFMDAVEIDGVELLGYTTWGVLTWSRRVPDKWVNAMALSMSIEMIKAMGP